MDELYQRAKRVLSGLWRRRWLGVAVAWLVCIPGWAAVMLLPPKYEASAQLYVAADPVLTPLLRGISIGGDSQSEFRLLRRTLLSKPNLQTLIDKTGLAGQTGGPGSTDPLIRQLQSSIVVDPQSDNLFSIRYTTNSRQRAYEVIQGLVNLYVERASSHNQGDMEKAARFLDTQIAYFHDQLKQLEQRRAIFEARYLQLLPGANGVSAYEAEQTTLENLTGALQDEQARKAKILSELSRTKAVLSAGSAGRSTSAALAAAESQLAQLEETFTDAYPGVVAAKARVEALKHGTAGAPVVAVGGQAIVANPVYEQLHLQLLQSENTLFSLRRQIASATAELKKLSAIAHAQPGLQAEYVNLNRNYGVLTTEYQDLIKRREAMRIGAAANINANQVQLQIVSPPQLPYLPVGPNRKFLLAGVLALGLFAGLATPVVVSELENCFETLDDLRRLGLPVLGAITEAGGRRRLGRAVLGLGLATGLLFFVFTGLMVGTELIPALA